jgi:hypothetical protein
MSHKGGYGGKSGKGHDIPTSVERALGKALNALLDFGCAMHDEGKKAGKEETTTGSGSGRVSGNKRRPRSQAQARKPNGQK